MMLHLRRFTFAMLAVLFSIVALGPDAAQACADTRRVEATALGITVHRAQPVRTAAAVPRTAGVAAADIGCCDAPAHVHGAGCATGCCLACASVVLAEMTWGVGVDPVVLR